MTAATFFKVLVAIESIFLLLPTTALFLFGLIVLAIPGLFSGQMFFILFVIPGYGLVSLWWLVLKYETESLQQIPKTIWVGIVLCGMIALWFVLFSGPLLMGGGPLIVLVTLLIVVWQQNRRPNTTPNSDAR